MKIIAQYLEIRQIYGLAINETEKINKLGWKKNSRTRLSGSKQVSD